jgi:hypothetical protein
MALASPPVLHQSQFRKSRLSGWMLPSSSQSETFMTITVGESHGWNSVRRIAFALFWLAVSIPTSQLFLFLFLIVVRLSFGAPPPPGESLEAPFLWIALFLHLGTPLAFLIAAFRGKLPGTN